MLNSISSIQTGGNDDYETPQLTSPAANSIILQAGTVLARGRIRRVWRPRYLELTSDGILKYYEAHQVDEDDDTRQHHAVAKEEKEEWEDVAESCCDRNNTTNNNNKNVETRHPLQPRYILLILRARLLNPSVPKDAKSGLPTDKFGFLFHGHILYYDASSEPNETRGVNILQLYSSRPFHCAVSKQTDAIQWVRALQSVAVSNSVGSVLPPRYAPLMTEGANRKEASATAPRTWEESLFDPLNIVSPLLHRPEKKVIAKEAPYTPEEQLRIQSDLEPEKGHPSPESDKNDTFSFQRLRQARLWELWAGSDCTPYLCALGGLAVWCGSILHKRLSAPSPPLFSARDTGVTVRADAAALGLAFAFVFGFRIGRYSNELSAAASEAEDEFTMNVSPLPIESTSLGHENVDDSISREEEEEEETPLSSPLHPFDGTINSWSEPAASMFKVRGTSYFMDRVKMPSGLSAFPCRGVEIWLADNPQRNIARHPSVLSGKLGEQDTFLVNFLLPFGNFVAYFTMTADEDLPLHVRDAWVKFRKGDQQYRDARLKLLPLVVEGPWIVKTVVGNGAAPALLGKVVPLQYFFTDSSTYSKKSVFEVDVIISASNIAKGILNVVKGNTKHLTLAFAIIIEAAEASELPENVLCAFQVHSLHLDRCPRLAECDLDCF